jgi:hypothetical protein
MIVCTSRRMRFNAAIGPQPVQEAQPQAEIHQFQQRQLGAGVALGALQQAKETNAALDALDAAQLSAETSGKAGSSAARAGNGRQARTDVVIELPSSTCASICMNNLFILC